MVIGSGLVPENGFLPNVSRDVDATNRGLKSWASEIKARARRKSARQQGQQMKILTGHVSPETAFVVDDYPYGFRLRCKIRYWLEYKPGKGMRFWSQTTNPKRPGEVWNKPKVSTFQRFGGVMLQGDNGHITWTGVSEYDEVNTLVKWRDDFGAAMPEAAQVALKAWITRKLSFEQAKIEGQVKMTMTTTQYDCGFGAPISPVHVDTRVLTSDYSPAELVAMGQTLRTPIGEVKL